MPITRPTNIVKPFADSGAKNTISITSASPQASFTEGFPPANLLPIPDGGVPPDGKDINGIFYSITTHTLWVNAGGQYLFDSTLSTAIGGYPKGMVLQSNDNLSSYISTVNNNTTDFNTTPSANWVPYAGANAVVTPQKLYFMCQF